LCAAHNSLSDLATADAYFIYNVSYISGINGQFDKKAIPFIDLAILNNSHPGRLFVSRSALMFEPRTMIDYEEYAMGDRFVQRSGVRYRTKLFRHGTVIGIKMGEKCYYYYKKGGFSDQDVALISQFCKGGDQ
jgi:hypothetical protein